MPSSEIESSTGRVEARSFDHLVQDRVANSELKPILFPYKTHCGDASAKGPLGVSCHPKEAREFVLASDRLLFHSWMSAAEVLVHVDEPWYDGCASCFNDRGIIMWSYCAGLRDLRDATSQYGDVDRSVARTPDVDGLTITED
jgi:hypothetical protein